MSSVTEEMSSEPAVVLSLTNTSVLTAPWPCTVAAMCTVTPDCGKPVKLTRTVLQFAVMSETSWALAGPAKPAITTQTPNTAAAALMARRIKGLGIGTSIWGMYFRRGHPLRRLYPSRDRDCQNCGELLDFRDLGRNATGFERPPGVIAVELEEVLHHVERFGFEFVPLRCGCVDGDHIRIDRDLRRARHEEPPREHVGRT